MPNHSKGRQVRRFVPDNRGHQVRRFDPDNRGHQVRRFDPDNRGHQVRRFDPDNRGRQVRRFDPDSSRGRQVKVRRRATNNSRRPQSRHGRLHNQVVIVYNNKKTFQSNANRPLADSQGFIVK